MADNNTDQNTNESSINNISVNANTASVGMNMDNSINQVPRGAVTYALNAALENFDANSVSYQNEQANELCLEFPTDYILIGQHFIAEQNKHIFFICNPDTGASEIGYMDNNDCIYRKYVSGECLNFNIQYPIHKVVHKITNCTTEIYWTDGLNARRYLDLNDIPYKIDSRVDVCNPTFTDELDCNQLKIQPNFEIPDLSVVDVRNGGDLKAGTYQFAIQYSNATGVGYTSYYSVTNPTPIADILITTLNFDYQVGKSIVVNVSNLDLSGQFQYYNLAVLKTINDITSVELLGTYFITNASQEIIYSGQNVSNIRLSILDIFEKYPYYDIAQDVTAVQDILVWDNLTSIDRINYQGIANQILLEWQSYRIPANENYADELNATNLRGYMRDEVYPFEIVFLLKNGKQTDGFHIPGRIADSLDFTPVPETNQDFIGDPDVYVGGVGYSPYWKIYNTGSVISTNPGYDPTNPEYKGPYQNGRFAYWESTDLYPCDTEIWGDLANQPIRHHKFPDVLVSPIFESAVPKIVSGRYSVEMQTSDAVFPIGVNVNLQQVEGLILNSNLTKEQKENIAGFKIIRGNRGTNKSIVAKGILRNVGKYNRQGTSYYFPNYPYNDLSKDEFLLNESNAYTSIDILTNTYGTVCRSFEITTTTATRVEYVDCSTKKTIIKDIPANTVGYVCALNFPKPDIISGNAFIVCKTYTRYKVYARGGFFAWTPTNIPGYTSPIPPPGVSIFVYSGITLPSGNPPLGFSTWPLYCLAYPTFTPCKRCLDPNLANSTPAGVWMSHYIFGTTQDAEWSYYLDSITPPKWISGSTDYTIEVVKSFNGDCAPKNLDGFNYPDSGYRQIFNSPETSFGQPFLGDVLKLENVIFGAGKAHFVQVRKNALYKLLTKEAQEDAVFSAGQMGGSAGFPFSWSVFYTAYQAYLQIYLAGISNRNFEYSFNSIARYDYSASIANNLGIKQRPLDIAQYLIPGVQSAGDDFNINNYNRESSVYLRTTKGTTLLPRTSLPFPDKTNSLLIGGGSLISDNSRFTITTKDPNDPTKTRGNCAAPEEESPINVVSYYASIKNMLPNQWGQIYTYDTLDTGFQRNIKDINTFGFIQTIFGGDTFISKFAFKTKLPFFIDNRVNAPDGSEVFYDELGNVAYPKYWHSGRSINYSAQTSRTQLPSLISIKAHNFDCPNSQLATINGIKNPGRLFYDGKMYSFAYGIPSFYCESAYNVDLRQAFNNREGDFFPHVSNNIPDDWLQQSFVPIIQDNTYYYNITYSKQNKENFFSHLPPDWKNELCFTNYPFRAVYSDRQDTNADNRTNNWLSYAPLSRFDFPQNYGNLISLDGIQNRAILARFENKSLLYNNLLTIDTSNPQAAYVGNPNMFSAPPIDFAETDLGYVGSQNKFLLKIPQGQITIDAKRGQVFLISGNQAMDISAFNSGMNRFFTDHLAFEILRYFPDINIDNHFTSIGLHGVYDSKFDRVIITKLDYIPINKNIKYDAVTREFYIERSYTQYPVITTTTTSSSTTSSTTTIYPPSTTTTTTLAPYVVREVVYLTDVEYFCNKSWTLSYNVNTNSWISFHSYIPNFYIAENNFFYSGINSCCSEFDAIVGGAPLEPTTTTTTSTSSTSTTSTTTTLAPEGKDCTLEGDAEQKDCGLSGTAVEEYEPTTTTTTTTIEPTTTTTTTTTGV